MKYFISCKKIKTISYIQKKNKRKAAVCALNGFE